MSTLKTLETVEDFLEAGLEFVDDDFVCGVSGGSPDKVSECWLDHDMYDSFVRVSNGFFMHKDWLAKEFAYRTNTGIKPEFTGGIVGKLRNGLEMIIPNNYDWKINGRECHADIIKWKPLLNQVQQKLTHEAETNINAIKESNEAMKKPVYTKEMHESGELPPVGSKFIVSGLEGDSRIIDFEDLEVDTIGVSETNHGNKVITFHHPLKGIGCGMFLTSGPWLKPPDTRTDKEKLRDALVDEWENNPDKDTIINAIMESDKFTITLKE